MFCLYFCIAISISAWLSIILFRTEMLYCIANKTADFCSTAPQSDKDWAASLATKLQGLCSS